MANTGRPGGTHQIGNKEFLSVLCLCGVGTGKVPVDLIGKVVPHCSRKKCKELHKAYKDLGETTNANSQE